MNMKTTNKELAEVLEEELVAFKEDLHQHPELSFEEVRTTKKLKDALTELGLEIVDLGLKTGVVARLKGEKPGKTVLLRADIDAIAQDEDPEHRVRSENDGVMHACGHDFHTTGLFGAAKILSGKRESLNGEVIFLFQPAEEITQGAKRVIDAGLYEKVGVPDYVFGVHNRPEIEAGKIGLHEGAVMSGKTHFIIELEGKTGHGGSPHKCSDVILCSAEIIETIQSIVSRNTDPLNSLVVSVLSIHAGTEENFVPESLKMTGSIRSLDAFSMEKAVERIREIAELTAKMHGCRANVTIQPDVAPTINDPKARVIAKRAVCCVVGEENVVVPRADMGSEDFSEYLKHSPGVFYWVGSGKPGKQNASWHNRSFETDDTALSVCAALYAQSAECALN